MQKFASLLGGLLIALIVFSCDARAQPQTANAPANPATVWSTQLQSVADRLKDPSIPDDVLRALRDSVDKIRGDAQKWIADQQPSIASVQAEIDALGPPPAEGAAPEAESVATLRRELAAKMSTTVGPIREAELVLARTAQLAADITTVRRDVFARQILARSPSPLSPEVWAEALPEFQIIGEEILSSATKILKAPDFQERLRQSLLALFVSVAVAIVLIWPLQRWLLRKYGRDPAIAKPTYFRVLRASFVVGATRSLIPTAAASLLYVVVLNEGLLTMGGQEIAQAIFAGLLMFTWTVALFRASLSPYEPNWRVIPVPTSFALGLRTTIFGLVLIFALDLVLSQIIVTFGARLVITEIRGFSLTAIGAAFLIVLMLRQKMWAIEEDGKTTTRWLLPRALVALCFLAVVALGAYGYVTLALFVVTQFVLTGALVLLLMVLHRLGIESLRQALSPGTWTGDRWRATMNFDDDATARFGFWAGFVYDAMLIAIGILAGVFLWGADRQDITTFLNRALFGFKIGEVTISLVDMVSATILFFGFLGATRILKRWLIDRVMPQTRIDAGTAESVGTVVGYLGIILATIIAITALGLDLSSLAIVAGALSVGIGFGLQAIVNNFVSGLILLVERPIKVGDWVLLGDMEGIVKRIKVRATEILTFDRATVFVPNSRLISEAVTNRSYPNKLGRMIIPIGVAYGSDVQLVRKTLLEIADAHSQVLRYPAPSAYFRGFGDNALNFELRCFLPDIGQIFEVTSELCFAIDEAFRRNAIEIAFPQMDIHLKQSAPDLSAALQSQDFLRRRYAANQPQEAPPPVERQEKQTK